MPQSSSSCRSCPSPSTSYTSLYQVGHHTPPSLGHYCLLYTAMPDAVDHGERRRGEVREGVTFYSLREWVLWLLFSGIEHERDGTNLQQLLHGVLVSLQDIGRW